MALPLAQACAFLLIMLTCCSAERIADGGASVADLQTESESNTTAQTQERTWCWEFQLEPLFFNNRAHDVGPDSLIVNVYDVGSGLTNINKGLSFTGLGGVFHAALEIGRIPTREWSFGGVAPQNPDRTGVMVNAPMGCSMHRYKCSTYIGETKLSNDAIVQRLGEIRDINHWVQKGAARAPDGLQFTTGAEWEGHTYNLLTHNCVYFTQALAQEMMQDKDYTLPSWIHRLARTGDWLTRKSSLLEDQHVPVSAHRAPVEVALAEAKEAIGAEEEGAWTKNR